jgi:16S rRNA (uracil1498-N3)-methyltransferase
MRGLWFLFTAMELPIFFMEEFSHQDVIILSEDISRHAIQVLRMQQGEKLQLTDGAGNLNTAEITDANKKKTIVNLIEKTYVPKKLNKVAIAISLLKNSSRFEWFLEKATEIGVSEIYPLLCQRTEKEHFRYDRMKQILISAMMQSKQVWLPVLHKPTTLNEVVTASTHLTKLIAHCEDKTRFLADFVKPQSVQILIGPEGDFTQEEIALALSKNYHAVTLGVNRLRTETAGVVAAAILVL